MKTGVPVPLAEENQEKLDPEATEPKLGGQKREQVFVCVIPEPFQVLLSTLMTNVESAV